MATPQVKDLVLRSPAGSSDVISFAWPLQIGHGQDKHDNGIDIIDTIKFVCDELPSMSSAFEETNLHQIDTACYKTMTGLVDRFNKAVDSIVALVSAFFFILSLYLQQEKIIRKEKLRKQNEFRFLRKCCQS